MSVIPSIPRRHAALPEASAGFARLVVVLPLVIACLGIAAILFAPRTDGGPPPYGLDSFATGSIPAPLFERRP